MDKAGKGMDKYPLLRKCLVVGIIFLFFGVSVLPSAYAKLVTLNTDATNVNYPTAKITQIWIGLIKDKTFVYGNTYQFQGIVVFSMEIYNGKIKPLFIIDTGIVLSYDEKIGIFSNHIICGLFFTNA